MPISWIVPQVASLIIFGSRKGTENGKFLEKICFFNKRMLYYMRIIATISKYANIERKYTLFTNERGM